MLNLLPKPSTVKDLRLAVRYIDDDLVFSETHAWTYMKVPTESYEFLSFSDRTQMGAKFHTAVGGLVTGTDTVDIHLLCTNRPFDVDAWGTVLNNRVAQQQPPPGWPELNNKMRRHLEGSGFLSKEVYLGVCLGSRRNKGKDDGFFAPFQKFVKKAERALALEDDYISAAEIEHFRPLASNIRRSMSASHIKTSGATANEVAWLITKPLYPEMVCPPPTSSDKQVWGPGEIASLGEGETLSSHRAIQVTQISAETNQEVEAFTATVCLSRFPDEMLVPNQEPWIHFASSLPFSVDFSSRMTLVPPLKVQKDVSKKLAEAKDQATHIAETGSAVPLDVQEQYHRATQLEYTIAQERQPWIYGWHRLAVSAPTKDKLNDRVRRVVEHYRDLGIDVSRPSGDQFSLLYERMPGDQVRTRAYHQRQELMLLGGGMPTASGEVGDKIGTDGRGWVGPCVGETTSRVRTLVNFSPHVAMARNKPPGVAITGAPGGGKSFFAFLLAFQCAMQGVWTIYIDPKADALPLARLAGLGSARALDLREGNDGMLDPFALGENQPEAILLALETVRLLLGGKQMSEEREEALMKAITTVAHNPDPSLGQVVDTLLAAEETAARNMGSVLAVIRDLEFARLCFAPAGGARIRPEDGLTVITLLGLDLPTAEMAVEDYGYSNRLAVSVMYLLTRFARRLMLSMDKAHPKAIFVDEAWAITSTVQGKKLIPEVARMGRSHNTALVLVSQNAKDLMDEGVTNSISSVFAFRSENKGEIDSVLELINVDNLEGNHRAIRELGNGECLVKDIDGRKARVKIDNWDQDLFRAFDTNPETRGKSG